MRNKQQKQKEDLIFELIKGGSPYKKEKWTKNHLINKIKEFKLSQKQSLVQMKKSILITKDNPLTSSKGQKRVSFLDEQEQKSKRESERIRRRLFEQKMQEEQAKKQLKRSIDATYSKVEFLIDNLENKNPSGCFQTHKNSMNIEMTQSQGLNFSGRTYSNSNTLFQSQSPIKYRYERGMMKESECQTIPIQNNPRQIIVRYRHEQKVNPQISASVVKYPHRIKSSPKILQSTVFSQTSPHSVNKYKDKVIKLSNLEETQSQFQIHSKKSISDFSKNQSQPQFFTPKRNKSLVTMSQQKSQWSKALSQSKFRHQIDVQIMKNRLLNKINQTKTNLTKRF